MSLILLIVGVPMLLVLLPWLLAAVGVAFWATSRCRSMVFDLRSSRSDPANVAR